MCMKMTCTIYKILLWVRPNIILHTAGEGGIGRQNQGGQNWPKPYRILDYPQEALLLEPI